MDRETTSGAKRSRSPDVATSTSKAASLLAKRQRVPTQNAPPLSAEDVPTEGLAHADSAYDGDNDSGHSDVCSFTTVLLHVLLIARIFSTTMFRRLPHRGSGRTQSSALVTVSLSNRACPSRSAALEASSVSAVLGQVTKKITPSPRRERMASQANAANRPFQASRSRSARGLAMRSTRSS